MTETLKKFLLFFLLYPEEVWQQEFVHMQQFIYSKGLKPLIYNTVTTYINNPAMVYINPCNPGSGSDVQREIITQHKIIVGLLRISARISR